MLIPLRDLVYIRGIPDAEKSAGGIWIPDQAQTRMDQGIVKYIGPDVTTVKEGDYVLFPNYAGTLMNVEGEGLLIIMKEESITANMYYQAMDTFIPGLYFKDRDGEYFEANYEMIFELVAQGIANAEWYKKMRADSKIRNPRYVVTG